MEHTKEKLSALVREMQTATTYNKGVYILNIEFFLDKYSNEMFRAGAFFYILVESTFFTLFLRVVFVLFLACILLGMNKIDGFFQND